MVSPAWDNADMARVEARRWKAVTLANRGLTHRMVAEQMMSDYASGLTVQQVQAQVAVDISRALKEYRKRTDQGIEEKITAATLRYNDIRRQLYRVLAGEHYVLHSGEIVRDENGNPLRDNAPVLAALAQLRALEAEQARLEGTNAREKIDIALERRVDEESTDVVEAILAGFSAVPELEPAVRQRVLEAAGAHLRGPDGPEDDGIVDADIVE
jgi:Pyruvate/2-oxoacid:ferredoxin oxidoreductase gamma subunit